MRLIYFCIGFSLLINSAWAGGYAGALERLLIYFAYQIDGLNDPDQQTLGFKCAKPNGKSGWDKASKTCPVGEGPDGIKWRSCGEVVKRDPAARCNFRELMYFLGGSQRNAALIPAGASERVPPITETAVNYFKHITEQQHSTVRDYGGEAFLKTTNGGEYNDMLQQIGDKVTAMAPKYRSVAPELFNAFTQASRKILEARVGDHGYHLIKELQSQSWIVSGDMQVKTEQVGSGQSPVDDMYDKVAKQRTGPTPWQTVDWDGTLKSSKLGVEVSFNYLIAFMSKFYKVGGDPHKHLVVIENLHDLSKRSKSC